MSIPFTQDPIQGTLDCLVDQGLMTQAQADEIAKAATTLMSMGVSAPAALQMALQLATAKAAGGATTGFTDPLLYAGNLGNEGVPASELVTIVNNIDNVLDVVSFTPKEGTIGMVVYDGFNLDGTEVMVMSRMVDFGSPTSIQPVDFHADDQIPVNGYALITWPSESITIRLETTNLSPLIRVKVVYIPA